MGLGWNLRICISSKKPGDTGSWTILVDGWMLMHKIRIYLTIQEYWAHSNNSNNDNEKNNDGDYCSLNVYHMSYTLFSASPILCIWSSNNLVRQTIVITFQRKKLSLTEMNWVKVTRPVGDRAGNLPRHVWSQTLSGQALLAQCPHSLPYQSSDKHPFITRRNWWYKLSLTFNSASFSFQNLCCTSSCRKVQERLCLRKQI